MGGEGQIAHARWPEYDEAKCTESTVEVLSAGERQPKARLNLPVDAPREEALTAAKADPAVAAALEGKTLVKEIAVPNKLINLVVKG